MSHIGIHLNTENKDDANLRKALDHIAETESRSLSDFLRLLLWAMLERYDHERPFFAAQGIAPPAVNPYRALFLVNGKK